MQRDFDDESRMVRLGQGESDLGTDRSFSKIGIVNRLLQRRLEVLSRVQQLAESLGFGGDHGYTCETASLFYRNFVVPLWEGYIADTAKEFPFQKWSREAELAQHPLSREEARTAYEEIERLFRTVEECRAFELIRSNRDRCNYVLTTHSRIVAMTCTHAAIRREDFLTMDFRYDSLIVEEAGQMLEIETVIPMLLQKPGDSAEMENLRRCVLIGDHNQLPPVVRNVAIAQYSRFDQSLFARLVRLGNRTIVLDQQGRARPSLAELYQWRYPALGNLALVEGALKRMFDAANPGFAYEFQLIDVPDENAESEPVPFFFQNLAEAEYVAAVYQYMRLIGYPREKIAVLTTYNGQRHLLVDVISARIAWNPSLGLPSRISTVDKYQGQENDFILLSLVRSKAIGHLRDIRRMIVALSRARLGLYVFGRASILSGSPELGPVLDLLTTDRPTNLILTDNENFRDAVRKVDDREGNRIINNAAEMAEHVEKVASGKQSL